MRSNCLICALLCMLLLTACGQKGDLYLEKDILDEGPGVTEPVTEATKNNSASEQADK